MSNSHKTPHLSNTEVSSPEPQMEAIQPQPIRPIQAIPIGAVVTFSLFFVIFLGIITYNPDNVPSLATLLSVAQPTTAPTATPTLPVPSPTPTKTLPTPIKQPTLPPLRSSVYSLDLPEYTEFAGSQVYTLSFTEYEDWSVQTSLLAKPEGAFRDCVEIRVVATLPEASQSAALLKITPICTSWSAEYQVRPNDSVIVEDKTVEGAAGPQPMHTIRYQLPDSTSYLYETAENNLDGTKLGALMLYSTNTDYFMAATVELVSTDSNPIDSQILYWMDEVVKSLAITKSN